MSKRRTKVEEIRNPKKYFKSFIAYEARKDKEKDQEFYNLIRSLSELFTGGDGSTKSENRLLLADNLNGEEFEKYISEASVFGWIEMIENETLLAAIMQLSEKEKLFLTLRYQYGLSQPEVAQITGVTQQATSKFEIKILGKIKKSFKYGCGNP